MKGKQEWRTTAATSPSALEILAQEEAETELETKVRYKAPKQNTRQPYRPWEDPKAVEEHSRKVREKGLAEVSTHDLYVEEIAEAYVEPNVNFIEFGCHETYSQNGCEGEFDILARGRDHTHTYFEIKSSNCNAEIETAYDQFERAMKAFPERKWNFILCTPEPNNKYSLTDCTDEAKRRQGEQK